MRDLAPFLARGTWQPNQRAGQQGSAAPGPISFSALMEVGALADYQQGLMQLLAVSNAQGCAGAKSLIHWHQNNRHQDRERTKWGYPRQFRSLTASDQDEVRRIQKLLSELGPTLVDLGLLAPWVTDADPLGLRASRGRGAGAGGKALPSRPVPQRDLSSNLKFDLQLDDFSVYSWPA